MDVEQLRHVRLPLSLFRPAPLLIKQRPLTRLRVVRDRIANLLFDLISLLKALDNAQRLVVVEREGDFDRRRRLVLLVREDLLLSAFLRLGELDVLVLVQLASDDVATEVDATRAGERQSSKERTMRRKAYRARAA